MNNEAQILAVNQTRKGLLFLASQRASGIALVGLFNLPALVRSNYFVTNAPGPLAARAAYRAGINQQVKEMVHLSEIEHSDLVSSRHQVFAYVFNYMNRRKVSPWKVNGYWYGQPLTVDCFWQDGSSLKVRRMMLACYDRLLFPIEVERAGLIPYFSLLPTRKNYHLTNTTR